MNLKDKKGSISIFVLIALLFMSAFLIISYANNVNKSKNAKEQFNIISDIYAYLGGDEGAYDKAYTDLRNKNKQTMTASVDNSSTIELTKTFEDKMSNYRIYGSGTGIDLPEEYQQVEYIESSGAQEIREFYKIPETYTTIEFETKTNSTSATEQGVIGVKSRLELGYASNNLNRVFLWNGPTVGSVAYIATESARNKDIILRATLSNGNSRTLYTNLDNGQTVTSNTNYTSINDSYVDLSVYTGTRDYYFVGKIYYVKVIVDNKIVRYMVPCYRKIDNVTGMYDIANNVFYTNTGTGTFGIGSTVGKGIGDLIADASNENYGKYKIPIKLNNENGKSITKDIILDEPLYNGDYIDFKTKKVVRSDGTEKNIDLPELSTFEDYTKIEVLTEVTPSKIGVEYLGYIISEFDKNYVKCEYIESTGTQYILTDIIPADNIGARLEFFMESTSGDTIFLGSRSISSGRFWMGQYESKFYFGWNTLTDSRSRPTVSANKKIVSQINYFNDKKQIYDGVLFQEITSEYEGNTQPMTIFAGNDNGKIVYYSRIRLYSLVITEGYSIISNYIPCYRKEDGEVGLYDIKREKFYKNAGTGEFVAGPEV